MQYRDKIRYIRATKQNKTKQKQLQNTETKQSRKNDKRFVCKYRGNIFIASYNQLAVNSTSTYLHIFYTLSKKIPFSLQGPMREEL